MTVNQLIGVFEEFKEHYGDLPILFLDRDGWREFIIGKMICRDVKDDDTKQEGDPGYPVCMLTLNGKRLLLKD